MLIKIEPRTKKSLDDIPQTWEAFFEKHKSLIKRCIESAGEIKIPLPENVFEAFHLTPLPRVRVVLIGEDPFPNINQSTGLPFAQGLSFSYSREDKKSRSFANIETELRRCYPEIIVNSSCLTPWAFQGVLLINKALTFNKPPGFAFNTDIDKWTEFIIEVIKEIRTVNPECLFVLWGKKAETVVARVNGLKTLVAGHPSPQNRIVPFVGCDHFRKINEHLVKIGQEPICWDVL